VTVHAARAALDASRGLFAAPDGHPAPQLWLAAQGVLQELLDRPSLTGQALVSEVRQAGMINLADAHALVALAAWADRTTGLAENEAERILVREAWMALEHAVPEAPLSSYAPPPAGTPHAAAQQWAPPGAGAAARSAAGAAAGAAASAAARSATSQAYEAGAAGSAHAGAFPTGGDTLAHSAPSRWRRWLWPAVGAAVLLVGLGAGTVWWFTTGKPERELADAVSAYQRGSREVARTTFARLAMEHPDDARPLVYLGRITREDGDLARARTFLTNAVRLAPESAVAARELAGIMLADGQPEIARRFYVRALQLDPNDRMAQGFLGCALIRLGRFDEAPRWIQRAGPGEWQQCLASIPAPPGMPSPYPMSLPR